MKIMEKIYDFIWVLFRPSFWIMNHKYSEAYDKWLSKQLDNDVYIEKVDKFTSFIGGKEIWLSNYPYGYGMPFPKCDIRPKRRTIYRLRQAEMKSLYRDWDLRQ